MINYRKLKETDLNDLVKLWNRNVTIYKPFTEKEYQQHVFQHPDFSFDGAHVALDDEKIVGISIALVRKFEQNDDTRPGYLTTILVDSDYRSIGIGEKLISLACDYVLSKGKKSIEIGYRSTLNYPWYIPNTPKHDHAGAPGVIVNSELYLYLINHGFIVIDHQDAFHQNLDQFKIPCDVEEKIRKNEKDGYIIELYDAKKHYGIEEFYQSINDEGFERVIRANLALKEPKPFLVINHEGRILGWTGAMYNEESGRAHFDGIAISPEIRKRGLGQGLWCNLAKYSKQNGAKFMTFFTGRMNYARYIYMKSGFKIIQSFAIMRKEIK